MLAMKYKFFDLMSRIKMLDIHYKLDTDFFRIGLHKSNTIYLSGLRSMDRKGFILSLGIVFFVLSYYVGMPLGESGDYEQDNDPINLPCLTDGEESKT